MIPGQSAATAAVLATTNNVAPQRLIYKVSGNYLWDDKQR
ncbi:hypothetical protein [Spirosoma harenae]